MTQTNAWRYVFLGTLITILPVMIAIQLFRIQVSPKQIDALNQQSLIHSGYYHEFKPARGTIYDRWGHPLASNKTVYEIGVELSEVRNPATIAQTLSLLVEADYDEVFAAASIEPSDDAIYAVLARNVTQEQVNHLEILMDQMRLTYGYNTEEGTPSLSGLQWRSYLTRTYPEGSHASNILGFVGHQNQGFYGLEGYYNDLLAGKSKLVWLPSDPNLVEGLQEIPSGVSLVLTIDREIQASIEAFTDKAKKRNSAESATIVVLDPKTGEVLAMATTPRLNLNEYWRYSEVFPGATPFNRAISQAYETGSVYKVFTMAAGLDSGAVTPDTIFLDTGMIEIGGTPIYNWNRGSWGPQDMTGCMQHSLNVCLAWIATEIGPKDFYDYMNSFGMGRLFGIDLAGEVTGRLKRPGDADWYEADLGTNAFGQGVSSTALQMASATAAIANGGKIMAPHIVRSMVSKGYQHDTELRVIAQPISAETAHTLSEMLAKSLEIEASDALVPGYRVAGKTGTGEIPTPLGYTSNLSNASFVGWGPVDDPQFLVYVWLEKPQTSIWGSEVAAPVFSQVVQELVVLMDIPPDDVRQQLLGQ